ncbi:MAG: septation protein SepH [Beutenbergiaceae bacterium]
MAELELVGIHSDGEHIVLVDDEGQRHRVAIDDALRAAVRRDRPNLEQLRSDVLRPREIQARIRAGASAADIAADSGMPLEQIRRYEGPALAEREHVAQRAQQIEIGREPGSPTLGDLVVDRLAVRGVDQIRWDARRSPAGPWEVLACFAEDDGQRQAQWVVDLSVGSVQASNDEGRSLSETTLREAGDRRHLNAVRAARLYDVETDADLAPQPVDSVIRDTRPMALRSLPPAHDDSGSQASAHDPEPVPASSQVAVPEQPPAAQTESLLDELSAVRGVRQQVEIDDDALADRVEDEGLLNPVEDDALLEQADDEALLNRVDSTPMLWDELEQVANPGAAKPRATTVPARKSKSRRTSVPSWDEIVFGARND